MRSPGILNIGNLAIHVEIAENPFVKTVLIMIATHASSAVTSFPAAAHAGERGGDMVFRHVLSAKRSTVISTSHRLMKFADLDQLFMLYVLDV